MTSISKSLVVFGAGLVVVWLLLPPAWAGALAGFNALSSARERQLRRQVGELLRRNGVAADELPDTLYMRVQKARSMPAARQDLEGLLKGRTVPRMGLFGLALIVSVALFGAVAALCCKITMDATLVGVLPLVNYLIGDPLLRFDLRSKLDSPAQGLILLAAQIGICYLCGSLSASAAVKRNAERWKRSRRP